MSPRKLSGEGTLAALEERIGHVFADRELLDRALTHVSLSGARHNYQRLEFLGDRVLGLAVAELLTHAFPNAREGELSRRLAELVRRETCVEVARDDWRVGAALRLGAGERMTGGADKAAILGDVCEAIIGAVFLDGGWEPARDLVERFWSERIDSQPRRLADPKTELQEWAQARGLPPPSYIELSREGPPHQPVFTIAARLSTGEQDQATAGSKRQAEQAAARALLARMESQP